jgi:hypothetical protein
MVKSRTVKWVRHVACIWAKRNAYRVLVGKPEGKRTMGRPICRREDNIKMYVGEMGLGWYGLV